MRSHMVTVSQGAGHGRVVKSVKISGILDEDP